MKSSYVFEVDDEGNPSLIQYNENGERLNMWFHLEVAIKLEQIAANIREDSVYTRKNEQ